MAATVSTQSGFICQIFAKSTAYPAPSSYFSYFLGKKLPAPLSFSKNRRSVASAIVKASGAKEQKLVHEGLITESLPNGMFRVKLENDDVILGHISGRIRKSYIRILPGDKVKIEVSVYDSTRGRIIYRN